MNDILLSEQKLLDDLWKHQTACFCMAVCLKIYDGHTALFEIPVRVALLTDKLVSLVPIGNNHKSILPECYLGGAIATHATLFSKSGLKIAEVSVGWPHEKAVIKLERLHITPGQLFELKHIDFYRGTHYAISTTSKLN